MLSGRKKKHIGMKALCILSFVLALVSLASRLYFSNRLAVKNAGLQDLFVQKTELERSIASLSYETSVLSSLGNIEHRATALGFKKIEGPLLSVEIRSGVPVAALSVKN